MNVCHILGFYRRSKVICKNQMHLTSYIKSYVKFQTIVLSCQFVLCFVPPATILHTVLRHIYIYIPVSITIILIISTLRNISAWLFISDCLSVLLLNFCRWISALHAAWHKNHSINLVFTENRTVAVASPCLAMHVFDLCAYILSGRCPSAFWHR